MRMGYILCLLYTGKDCVVTRRAKKIVKSNHENNYCLIWFDYRKSLYGIGREYVCKEFLLH